MTDTNSTSDQGLDLAQRLSDLFMIYDQVDVVALSGSRTSGVGLDARSDIDLAVYTAQGDFPLAERKRIVERLGGASRTSLGLTFWGDGAMWVDAASGIEVDVIYSSQHKIESELNRILVQHKPAGSYSTCAWHSVRSAQILFDRSGWYRRLQTWSDQPYPAQLRRAIIEYTFPILRDIVPSYRDNIEKSLPRNDLVFIMNEVTWMLASYFDILFAYNEVPHPGAKRMLANVSRLCQHTPQDLANQVTRLLQLTPTGSDEILVKIDDLVDGLEGLLKASNFLK